MISVGLWEGGAPVFETLFETLCLCLGSGVGKGVFAAALLAPFGRLIGIEILDGLHRAALEVHKVLKYSTHLIFMGCCCLIWCVFSFQKFTKMNKSLRSEKFWNQEFSFVRESFLDFDWSDGDVVFVNSTWCIWTMWFIWNHSLC